MARTPGCPFLFTSNLGVSYVELEALAASEEPEIQQQSFVSATALAGGRVLLAFSPPGSPG